MTKQKCTFFEISGVLKKNDFKKRGAEKPCGCKVTRGVQYFIRILLPKNELGGKMIFLLK